MTQLNDAMTRGPSMPTVPTTLREVTVTGSVPVVVPLELETLTGTNIPPPRPSVSDVLGVSLPGGPAALAEALKNLVDSLPQVTGPVAQAGDIDVEALLSLPTLEQFSLPDTARLIRSVADRAALPWLTDARATACIAHQDKAALQLFGPSDLSTRDKLTQFAEHIGQCGDHIFRPQVPVWNSVAQAYPQVSGGLTPQNFFATESVKAGRDPGAGQAITRRRAAQSGSNVYELWGEAGPSADDIIQGKLNDCYILVALASMAMKDPKVLDDMIRSNPDGTYTVSLYAMEDDGSGNAQLKKPLKQVEIVVDPSTLSKTGAVQADNDNDGKVEIGAALVEAAFAQYNDQLLQEFPSMRAFGLSGSGLSGIERGFADVAYQAISGEAASFEFVGELNDKTLTSILATANHGEAVMVSSLTPPGTDGIAPAHAYSVLGLVDTSDGPMVALRNPWGVGEPGNDGQDDGIFLISLSEFKESFGEIMFDDDARQSGMDPLRQTTFAKALSHFTGVVDGKPAAPPPGITVAIDQALSGADDDAVLASFSDGAAGINWENADINAVVQWVLRESYLATTQDLAYYAEKVKFYNGVKKQIREELARAREALVPMAGMKPGDPVNPPFVSPIIDTTFYGTGVDLGRPSAVAPIEAPPLGSAHAEVRAEAGSGNGGRIAAGGLFDSVVNGISNVAGGIVGAAGEVLTTSTGGLLGGLLGGGGGGGLLGGVLGGGGLLGGVLGGGGGGLLGGLLGGGGGGGGGLLGGLLGGGGQGAGGSAGVQEDPGPPVIPWKSGEPATQKEHLETLIGNLEEKLNSVGDDAQLANVDLQNMLQKQQQTLQMMSNISKMLHDTAMAIIRKIGG